MDPSDALVIVTAVATAISTGATTLYATLARLRRTRSEEAPAQRTVEERLEAISELTRKSSREMEELSAEIEARKATAERLQAEAEEAERLAQLNQEARDAVARLVGAEIANQSKRATRQQVWLNVGFFITGALISLLITLFVHPLS